MALVKNIQTIYMPRLNVTSLKPTIIKMAGRYMMQPCNQVQKPPLEVRRPTFLVAGYKVLSLNGKTGKLFAQKIQFFIQRMLLTVIYEYSQLYRPKIFSCSYGQLFCLFCLNRLSSKRIPERQKMGKLVEKHCAIGGTVAEFEFLVKFPYLHSRSTEIHRVQ